MQRFRALCRRYAPWILITLALLLCQRWWMARGKPERLLELPEGAGLRRLHNGILTLERSALPSFQQHMMQVRRPGSSRLIPVMTPSGTPAAPALFTMPATGGPLRPVSPDSIEAAPPDTMLTAGTDTYRIEYRTTTPGLVGIPPGYGRSFGSGTAGYSVSAPSPPPKPRPPFHTVTYREEADSGTAILRRLSDSGVPTAETLTLPMGYIAKSHFLRSGTPSIFFKSSIAFSGNAVCWIKSFPDETTYHESSNGLTVGNSVSKYRSAVMTMPLHGGTPRKLLDDVSETTTLLASEDGVLCGISQGSRQGWLRLRPDGTTQKVLINYSQFENPAEGNHHLYWTQSNVQPVDNSVTVQIMQTNADGSSPRALYKAVNPTQVKIWQWRGQVYFHIVDTPVPGQQASVYKSTLYRVNPATSSGVERLCALPDNVEEMRFDGDYLYCLAREEKAGLMDTFRSNSSADTRRVLYRYRLPSS